MKITNIIIRFNKITHHSECVVIENSNFILVTKFIDINKVPNYQSLMDLLGDCYRSWHSTPMFGDIWLDGMHYSEVWPSLINFDELDHSNNDNIDIEITWKYKNAIAINNFNVKL